MFASLSSPPPSFSRERELPPPQEFSHPCCGLRFLWGSYCTTSNLPKCCSRDDSLPEKNSPNAVFTIPLHTVSVSRTDGMTAGDSAWHRTVVWSCDDLGTRTHVCHSLTGSARSYWRGHVGEGCRVAGDAEPGLSRGTGSSQAWAKADRQTEDAASSYPLGVDPQE